MKSINLKSNNLKYLAGGVVILLLAIALRPFVIINPGQRGIVTNLGKVSNRVLGEGIHPIVPIVTTVTPMNVRVQQNSFDAQAASKDLQSLTTKVALNWSIEPERVNDVFQKIGTNTEVVTNIITPAVAEVVKASTSTKTAEEAITQRNELKKVIDESLKNRLAPYGILVRDISITDFTFSEEFSRAIEAKQIAEQEAKQAEFIAKKATQEAQAEINRAKGQAEAQRLQRLTLTPELLQKQAIEKWDGKFPTVMGANSTLFIDPNKLGSK